jgi:hypothetical protein
MSLYVATARGESFGVAVSSVLGLVAEGCYSESAYSDNKSYHNDSISHDLQQDSQSSRLIIFPMLAAAKHPYGHDVST